MITAFGKPQTELGVKSIATSANQGLNMSNNKHRMKCNDCGEYFDMRSLQEVALHEHEGSVPTSDIVGGQVDES